VRSLPSLLALNLIAHLLGRTFDLLLKCMILRAHDYIEEKHVTGGLQCEANATSSPTDRVLTRSRVLIITVASITGLSVTVLLLSDADTRLTISEGKKHIFDSEYQEESGRYNPHEVTARLTSVECFAMIRRSTL